MTASHSFLAALVLTTGLLIGCGENRTPPSKSTIKLAKRPDAESSGNEASGLSDVKKRFQPIQLGDDGGGAADKPVATAKVPEELRAQSVVDALQPFQVLLGQWRWIARKGVGDSPRNGDDLEWIWDFQTDPNRPALKAKSETNPYFQKLWLTWLPEEEKFQLTLKTLDGAARVLRGTWTDTGEPRETSDGKKLQHTYKLQLTQVTPDEQDRWRVTLNQLDNNQYLMDLARRPAAGKQFDPLNTVRQQRVGTSFAVADSDNPGPKCIISGGLGTMNVEYKGKSYPVCCSGCAAAFKDDPERWLTRLAEREKLKKRQDE
jgi:hypothetical protein